MKLKLNTIIRDLDDYPIPFTENARDKKTGKTLYEDDNKLVPKMNEHNMTLKDAFIGALMSAMKDDENMDADKKCTLFSLAMDIKKGTADLTVEELAIIKERVGKRYPALICGRVVNLIDGKTSK